MHKKILILFLLCPFHTFAQSCPSGMVAVEYDAFVPATGGACPSGYVAHDVETICGAGDGACWLVRMLCTAGITMLNTSGGLSFPLYSDKSTSPSIYVKYNDTVCYADLEVGSATGAINIKYNDVIYHTVQ